MRHVRLGFAAAGCTGRFKCCEVAQANNVKVDDRGYVYIVDRANTGLHVLELTGAAWKVANLR